MIYIIKHKEYDTPKLKDYKDLYVGDMFEYNNLDNINKLNPYINEATGLYHIWKNCDDKIVGLVHYRRFFGSKNNFLKSSDIKYILRDYDIIIPYNVIFDRTIYEQLRIEMPPNEDIVLDKYYNKLCEIEPKLKKYFDKKEFAPKEMFVCKKEIINKYCEWLFSFIIPITEEFIKEDSEKLLQKRMIGHLVERLFYFWIKDNNLKIYRMNIKEI